MKNDFEVPDVRLKEILYKFGYDYMSDKNLFLTSNLNWLYRNLHVRNRRDVDYIECIDRIENLLYE